jgi:hypothetical protein
MATAKHPDTSPSHVLSFFTDADGDQVFMHADAAGLDFLIQRLSSLRTHLDRGECEHEHLFTSAWTGSGHLSTRGAGEGDHLVQHVKIYAWTSEWVQKHHLSDTDDESTPTV